MTPSVPPTHRAVFLDRDGTVIIDKGYLKDPAEIELLPGVPQRLRQLVERGFLLVIVTNQSGVGRGFFTLQDLQRQHDRLQSLLQQQKVPIAAIEFCPHHPDIDCDCRKPKPGMLLCAAQRLHIDLHQSFMVGDRLSDIQAGKNAGCTTVMIGEAKPRPEIDAQAPNAADALELILQSP